MGRVPPILLLHAIFAAAALPLMMAAMLHFVPVLTRSGRPSLGLRWLPWVGWLAGALVLAVFSGVVPRATLWLAAALDAGSAVVLGVWIMRRRRQALGPAHPGVTWYLAALAMLLVGMGSVAGMLMGGAYGFWRNLHLHGNLFGWIGLTALGTLAVLLPTAVGRADASAARRLASDLKWALPGVALIALGAAAGVSGAAAAGGLCLVAVIARQFLAWKSAFGLDALSGAAGSLFLGSWFLLLTLVGGIAHGLGVLASPPPAASFIQGFLLPLVTGALAQLLPVWCYPGVGTPERDTFRRALGTHATVRGVVFFFAGCLQWAGGGLVAVADILVLAALLSFILAARDCWRRPGRT
jgi:hypothetical protein